MLSPSKTIFPILLFTLHHALVVSLAFHHQHHCAGRKGLTPLRSTAESAISHPTSHLPPITKNCDVVSAMPDPIPPLKNTYYLLRHGQSTGNVAGVISSSRTMARNDEHGLTNRGYQQGRESAEQLLQLLKEGGKKKVVFYSSPFARARQTAQACLDGLNEDWMSEVEAMGLDVQQDIILVDDLMERYFGKLDAEKLYTYAYVWPNDLFNVTHTAFDVESVAAVCQRVRDLLVQIDEEQLSDEVVADDTAVVLVSHADVLQIAQVYAAGAKNVGTFSQYRFGNGEVRLMGRTVDTLPEAKPLLPPKKGT